jgi:hypothetical protein
LVARGGTVKVNVNRGNELDEYKRWNDAVAEFFFNPTRKGHRCFLAVDETTLARIAETHGFTGDPVQSFIATVKDLMPPENLFTGMHSYGIQWDRKRTKEPPLFIGGLGVAVLAATRMGHDPSQGVASHNYYIHLNALLGRPSDAGMPVGFDQLPKLWGLLAEWLNGVWTGRLGLPTAMQMGRQYIGWPISQALVRRADVREFRSLRQRLREFDLEEITAEDVLPFLKRWISEDGAASRLARLLGRQPVQEALLNVAEHLTGVLSEWEAEEQGSGRGETVANLHLYANGFNYTSVSVQLAWRCPPDVEEEVKIRLPDGAFLSYKPRGEWIGVAAAQTKWFQGSSKLECDGRTVISNLSTPLVFVRGDGYGRPGWWVATQREIPLGESCLIIAPPWESAAIRSALTLAQSGWKYHERLGGLPEGWVLFSGVMFTEPPKGVFGSYRSRVLRPWALDGGIRIHHYTWLQNALPRIDAEPDVLLEVVDVGDSVVKTIAGGTDLNGLNLEPGAYTIRGEGVRSRRLVVISPAWPSPRPEHDKSLTYFLGANRTILRVRGALIEGSSALPSPVLLPRNLPQILIGPSIGNVRRIAGPAVAGFVAWTGNFRPTWAIRVKGKKVIEVVPVSDELQVPVPEFGGRRRDRHHWAALIVKGRNRLGKLNPAQREIYAQYLRLAREVD